MDTFDAIYQRRAVKRFDPEHRIRPEDERRLLEAAVQSPTSFNIQHWASSSCATQSCARKSARSPSIRARSPTPRCWC